MANGQKVVKVKLNVDASTYAGTAYAQVALVNVTDTEVTMDFVYVHPSNLLKAADLKSDKPKEQKAQIVSRVVMPVAQAKQFADAVLNTIEKHVKKNQ